jgi:cob(I)alamin adenosyltransferase
MVNLTRIYTKTGDDGTTALGDMSRTGKNDLRLVAYADVDEANSALGVVLAGPGVDPEVRAVLLRVQNELFDVGADLCTPVVAEPAVPPLRVEPDYVARLEADIDRFNADLPSLRSFVLPGGTAASAHLHVARTITRRAERATWAALAEHGDVMTALPATYLNRLSDLLFVLARHANLGAGGDVLWRPGGDRG